MVSAPDNVVAIVDPYSSGSYLQAEFATRGWSSVAVLSTPTVPSAYGTLKHADGYREVLVCHNVDEVLAGVAKHTPRAVIPGTEIGVPLADELAERLGLPGNGVALSACRRNKYAMSQALLRCGLAAPATITATAAETVLRWADDHAVWPVVVKPVDSAGSDGVTFCFTPAEVHTAFQTLHDRPHQLGGHNDVVLAQELLRGQQYFVNTISVDGKHYLAETWKDTRHPVAGASLAYDVEELLSPLDERQDTLSAYVFDVLDTLGIRWGPAHSEIMLTDRGPVLIETGARMQGTILPDSVRAATGQNQVTLTVDCYTNPDLILDRLDEPYPLNLNVRVVSLIAPYDGHIAVNNIAAQLRRLPTLHDVIGDIAPGTPVMRTVDLFTSPASLYLIADDVPQVDQDYARIRELEALGLYATDAGDSGG
jgi:biotin carboxylase